MPKSRASRIKNTKSNSRETKQLFLAISFVVVMSLLVYRFFFINTPKSKGAGADSISCACPHNPVTDKALFDDCLRTCKSKADNFNRNQSMSGRDPAMFDSD